MSDVHFLHARLIDPGALGNTALSLVVFVEFLKLSSKQVPSTCQDTRFLLLVLLEAHDQFLESFFVSLLNYKILDGRV